MKRNRIISLVLIMSALLGMLNLLACGPLDKPRASKNAIKYIETKYGFTPTITSMYEQESGGEFSLPTGTWTVEMTYMGTSFHTYVDEDSIDGAMDNYQDEEIVAEAIAYFTEMIPAEDIFIETIRCGSKYEGMYDINTTSFDDVLRTGRFTVAANTYGLNEDQFLSFCEDMSRFDTPYRDKYIYVTNFREQSDFETYGSFDGNPYIMEEIVSLTDLFVQCIVGSTLRIHHFENIVYGDYTFTVDDYDGQCTVTEDGVDENGNPRFLAIGGDTSSSFGLYVTVPAEVANYVILDKYLVGKQVTDTIGSSYDEYWGRGMHTAIIYIPGEAYVSFSLTE